MGVNRGIPYTITTQHIRIPVIGVRVPQDSLVLPLTDNTRSLKENRVSIHVRQLGGPQNQNSRDTSVCEGHGVPRPPEVIFGQNFECGDTPKIATDAFGA